MEKLKPLEVELRRLEDLSESIVNDFAYMKKREEEMRDTNGEPLFILFFHSSAFPAHLRFPYVPCVIFINFLSIILLKFYFPVTLLPQVDGLSFLLQSPPMCEFSISVSSPCVV